jgi:hypothetical protein
MMLTEKHFRSVRGDDPESYQSLDVIQEAPQGNEVNGGRQFIRFTLMEQRWRSRKEAISYLQWCIGELRKLEK